MTIALKPFDKHDKEIYPGAEGDKPKIAYTDKATYIAEEFGATIMFYDAQHRELLAQYSYACEQTKAEIILSNLEEEQLTPEWLTAIGFEKIV